MLECLGDVEGFAWDEIWRHGAGREKADHYCKCIAFDFFMFIASHRGSPVDFPSGPVAKASQ
ncbi:hypothetical protein EMIT0P265_10817 [Pseudomonas zeae]